MTTIGKNKKVDEMVEIFKIDEKCT